MPDDAELLRDYVQSRSEAAFTELVRRHLGLVYNVALRRVGGDAHLAQDVTQQVFAELAKDARRLSRHPVVSGWLHRTTRYIAIDLARGEQRRIARERAAHLMPEPSDYPIGVAIDSEAIRPMLDEIIDKLDDRDRDAVTLRFFESRSFAEIGAQLHASENAARMRVDRALAKLQGLLSRRGLTSTGAALAAALSGQAGVSAPAGLAVVVVGGALASTGTAASGTALFAIMASTKMQTGVVAAAVLLAGTAIFYQANINSGLAAELATARRNLLEPSPTPTVDPTPKSVAQEVESYAGDTAALSELKTEAEGLRQQIPPTERPLVGPVFEPSDVDQLPAPIAQSRPMASEFMAYMRANGISKAVVTASYVVAADGAVHNVKVIASDYPGLEEVPGATIKQWTFQPGFKNGAAVNVRMEVPLTFVIALNPTQPDRITQHDWLPAK